MSDVNKHLNALQVLHSMNLGEEAQLVIDEALASKPVESEQTYMEAYGILKSVVETIQDMSEPDVDAIIPLIEKGMKAFKVCESRIKKVESYLAEMESE